MPFTIQILTASSVLFAARSFAGEGQATTKGIIKDPEKGHQLR